MQPPDPDALDLPESVRRAVAQWLQHPRYADLYVELAPIVSRAANGDRAALAELEDAFDGPLPIGTGGRRGRCGPGSNRLNAIVLRETAQGLADAMRAEAVPPSAVIVYDTRRDSRTFAGIVGEQLAANGIRVTIIDAPRPTPELSFTVRQRHAGAGVVISASHNPPEDNGIKIYDVDGAQVLGARDHALMQAIEAAMASDLVPAVGDDGARGRVNWLSSPSQLREVDAPYHRFVLDQGVLDRDLSPSGLRVVFTPLHGTGHSSVVPVLRARGLEPLLVEEQCDPDQGRFSTVASANPEAAESMDMAKALAERTQAHLVLATDPDADRLGALACDREGRFHFVDGNRLAVLMLDHVLRQGSVPQNGWVLTTLVTSPLVSALARSAGVDVVDDLLVGFKHHAGMMREQPDRPLVFACEESHGYSRGTEVRDKDGCVAALLLAECAASALANQETLFDRLAEIWRKHGYHRERTANLVAPGVTGREAIAEVMKTWRTIPPESFAGLRVIGVDDRSKPRRMASATRDLVGNVLVFELEGTADTACRVVLRPSGTEPKLKVYALGRCSGPLDERGLARMRLEVDTIVDRVVGAARVAAERIMAAVVAR